MLAVAHVSGAPAAIATAHLDGETWLTIGIHVPLHITVYIGLVTTVACTEELGRLAALILYVTIQAILPFVFTLAQLARPRLVLVAIVHHARRRGLRLIR